MSERKDVGGPEVEDDEAEEIEVAEAEAEKVEGGSGVQNGKKMHDLL